MSDLNPYEEGLALELQAAQKRIEALIEQLDAARKDADEAEAYAWELEQRLGAALEPAPTDAARARVIRNGEHLFNTAKSLGWADDGEGALEFVMRRTREVALEDAAQAREAALRTLGDAA